MKRKLGKLHGRKVRILQSAAEVAGKLQCGMWGASSAGEPFGVESQYFSGCDSEPKEASAQTSLGPCGGGAWEASLRLGHTHRVTEKGALGARVVGTEGARK